MKKSRMLNDTAAIQAMPIDPVQKSEYNSVSTRKIDNGYVTSRSSNKDGRYESNETFSAEPPVDSGDEGSNPLSKAVAYMQRTGTV